MKEQIATSHAPKAIGPYSQAVLVDNLFFISGQIAIEPETGLFAEGGVVEQARQVFRNVKAILNQAGMDFSHVVNATVFLADINDFSAVNDVYTDYFSNGILPSRSALEAAALPKNALVEMTCIAVRNK